MEPIFTDKQLNNMSREDLISLMKIVQEQTKKLFRPNGVFGKSSHSANQCIHFSHYSYLWDWRIILVEKKY